MTEIQVLGAIVVLSWVSVFSYLGLAARRDRIARAARRAATITKENY